MYGKDFSALIPLAKKVSIVLLLYRLPFAYNLLCNSTRLESRLLILFTQKMRLQ